jgi:hypothetical protein
MVIPLLKSESSQRVVFVHWWAGGEVSYFNRGLPLAACPLAFQTFGFSVEFFHEVHERNVDGFEERVRRSAAEAINGR